MLVSSKPTKRMPARAMSSTSLRMIGTSASTTSRRCRYASPERSSRQCTCAMWYGVGIATRTALLVCAISRVPSRANSPSSNGSIGPVIV